MGGVAAVVVGGKCAKLSCHVGESFREGATHTHASHPWFYMAKVGAW